MKPKSSKQAKACDISARVKAIVWARDKGRCILCADTMAFPNAHAIVSRAHGGLGVEENIITLCNHCHLEYDHGNDREYLRGRIESYLKSKYPNWNKADLVYRKGLAYGQVENTARDTDIQKR